MKDRNPLIWMKGVNGKKWMKVPYWGKEVVKQRSQKVMWTQKVRMSMSDRIARKEVRNMVKDGSVIAEVMTLADQLGIEI